MAQEQPPKSNETIESLASDPEIRRRLACTLSSAEMAPAAGEAMVLQLASLVPAPSIDRNAMPIHVGYGATAPLTVDLLFSRAAIAAPEAVSVLGPATPERPTRRSLPETDTAPVDPFNDPETRITLVDGLQHTGAGRDAIIRRAVTGAPRLADPQFSTREIGAIAIGHNAESSLDELRPVDKLVPIPPGVVAGLDLIVGISHPAERSWLDAPQEAPRGVRAIDPSLAEAYLEAVRQTEIEFGTDAQTYLAEYRAQMSIIPKDGVASERIPTVPSCLDTVCKLSQAVARLELSETVGSDHVETAVRIYEQSLSGRGFTIESLAFWREVVGDPVMAFRNEDAAFVELIETEFADQRSVSEEDLQESAPMFGLSRESVQPLLDRVAGDLGLIRTQEGRETHYKRLSHATAHSF